MLKSVVERQFGPIGEALVRLAKTEPNVAEQVTDHHRIIVEGDRRAARRGRGGTQDGHRLDVAGLRFATACGTSGRSAVPPAEGAPGRWLTDEAAQPGRRQDSYRTKRILVSSRRSCVLTRI